jgi:hypothetical protein
MGVMVVGASLVACGPGYSKLEVAELQSMSVATEGRAPGFCAYAPVALRAFVTYRNGEHAQSRIPGEDQRGRLRTSEFQWSSSHGTVDADAVLALPVDPLVWFDEPIEVRAHVLARPEIAAATTAQPRFDCGGTLDLRGSEGARGGEDEDGGPGAPAPVVEASLAYLETARSGRLVLLRAQRDGEEPEYFVIDPRTPVVLDARGGAGGRGGQGTAGVGGRAGLDACTEWNAGQAGTGGEPGGPGGPGRHGGVGGPGGRVLVRHDARFPELRAAVQVNIDGGEAGAAGSGGPGGRGGTRGKGCIGKDGSIGADGADGAQGPSGPAGQAGIAGPPGEVQEVAADVAALFAAELARGLPIVTGAGAVP